MRSPLICLITFTIVINMSLRHAPLVIVKSVHTAYNYCVIIPIRVISVINIYVLVIAFAPYYTPDLISYHIETFSYVLTKVTFLAYNLL